MQKLLIFTLYLALNCASCAHVTLRFPGGFERQFDVPDNTEDDTDIPVDKLVKRFFDQNLCKLGLHNSSCDQLFPSGCDNVKKCSVNIGLPEEFRNQDCSLDVGGKNDVCTYRNKYSYCCSTSEKYMSYIWSMVYVFGVVLFIMLCIFTVCILVPWINACCHECDGEDG